MAATAPKLSLHDILYRTFFTYANGEAVYLWDQHDMQLFDHLNAITNEKKWHNAVVIIKRFHGSELYDNQLNAIQHHIVDIVVHYSDVEVQTKGAPVRYIAEAVHECIRHRDTNMLFIVANNVCHAKRLDLATTQTLVGMMKAVHRPFKGLHETTQLFEWLIVLIERANKST